MSNPAEFWLRNCGGVVIPESRIHHGHRLQDSHTWQTVLEALAVHCWPDEDGGSWTKRCWGPGCQGVMFFKTLTIDGATQQHTFVCGQCGQKGTMVDLVTAVMGFTKSAELKYFFDSLPQRVPSVC